MICRDSQSLVWGLLLFLLFMNDLSANLNFQTRIFSDECILNMTIRSQPNSTAPQQDLRALGDWEHKWDMEFYPQKCNVTRSTSPIHTKGQGTCPWISGYHKIPGMWHIHHIDRICKKAKGTLEFLRRNLKAGTEVTKANAYFCMFRSNLDYCYSIWSSHHKDQTWKTKMIQRRAVHFTTNG